jgi:hypothetical protein
MGIDTALNTEKDDSTPQIDLQNQDNSWFLFV